MDDQRADGVDAARPDILDEVGEHLVCRVCGALVSPAGEYPAAHWAWHEAANGA